MTSYLSEQANEDSEGTANAVRPIQPPNLQMPNYELIAKFYTEHSSAQEHSSSLQPCDFRNQILKQQQALKRTVPLHQLSSKPYNAFIGASGYSGSWRGQKQRVGLVRRCKLSTAAVNKCTKYKQNHTEMLAATAVQTKAALMPAIFATDPLTNQQPIS